MSETLADIGEFGLIDRIRRLLKREGIQKSRVTLGIGDDAACFKPRPGSEILITCDSLVEGRHFLLQYTTFFDLGRRAMTANISDIGAMGGQPLYALISLGLKAGMRISEVEDMYHGFLEELNPLEASIIGGNITKVKDALFIDITLVGEVEPENLLRRSSAEVGDVILATGFPGQASAGLKLLTTTPFTEELKENPLIRAYNTPSHRAREGQRIARSGYAHAVIDTSDGFLGDLGHICEESGVGALLFQEKFPLSEDLKKACARLNLDPYDLFLKDSDDYELIITCQPERVEDIRSLLAAVSQVPASEVGEITEAAGEIRIILPDGSQSRLSPAGWNHFKI